MNVKPEHAAHAAALQLQVDQQERALGEAADARVEHAPDRHDGAADADAGDFDGGVHGVVASIGTSSLSPFFMGRGLG